MNFSYFKISTTLTNIAVVSVWVVTAKKQKCSIQIKKAIS